MERRVRRVVPGLIVCFSCGSDVLLLLFFAGASCRLTSTAANNSDMNRCVIITGGELTARTCLRELCCEFVSAIVYSVCDCCSVVLRL